MTEHAERVDVDAPLIWHRSGLGAVGIVGAVLLAALGLLFSRPDVVALGIPLALASAAAFAAKPASTGRLGLVLAAEIGDADAGEVSGRVDVRADADWVQIAVNQDGRRSAVVDTGPGAEVVRTRSTLRHSGPIDLLDVRARAIAGDGVWISEIADQAVLTWNAAPSAKWLHTLPLAPRLTGLHGGHPGSRPGQGGEFRDIHAFAPGDELRRVDWRATARLARRPGELLVRRTDALSDAAVVIALDTADDLGEVVATWGTGDPERSGTTSLDLGREAALSIASTAIEAGDRVSFHELAPGGRTIRSGAGRRHLEHLRGAIAATGASGDTMRFRRTPPLPTGAVVCVLSTFFDGSAGQLASRWQAMGHRVIAVDVLPVPDTARLQPAQRTALRSLMAEREDVFADLRHAGVDVLAWAGGGADAALRAASRVRR